MQGKVMLFCCHADLFFIMDLLNAMCMEGVQKCNKITPITASHIKSIQDLN